MSKSTEVWGNRDRRLAAIGAALLALVGIVGAGGLGGCNNQPKFDPATVSTTDSEVDRAATLVRQAQRYELAGKEDLAVDKYREAIITYHDLPVAWNNLGRLFMKQGDNVHAEESFKVAAELSPTDPRPMYNLGALWESIRYYDDALKWYEEALKRDENYLPALRHSVLMDEMRGRPDDGTFERIKRAMLQEKDPWWIERFQRAELLLRDTVAHKNADALAAPPPSGPQAPR